MAMAESKGDEPEGAHPAGHRRPCVELIRRGQLVTMPEAAKAAMVSEATAYRYFPDLASLLAKALADDGLPRLRPLLRWTRRMTLSNEWPSPPAFFSMGSPTPNRCPSDDFRHHCSARSLGPGPAGHPLWVDRVRPRPLCRGARICPPLLLLNCDSTSPSR